MTVARKRVAILVSGRGSNMGALIEAAKASDYPAQIVGVIADRADSAGLARASANGLFTDAILRAGFPGKEAHDQAIDATLHGLGAEIVCLAGYMRLLTAAFVTEWRGRMINIHPSLLPLFPGLDTHRRALEAGVRIHGCSVHFVTPAVDQGPIVAQAAVPVLSGDTEAALAARVLKAEHALYPLALRLVCEGRARMENGRAVVDTVADAPEGTRLLSASETGAGIEVDVQALARFTP